MKKNSKVYTSSPSKEDYVQLINHHNYLIISSFCMHPTRNTTLYTRAITLQDLYTTLRNPVTSKT